MSQKIRKNLFSQNNLFPQVVKNTTSIVKTSRENETTQ